MNFRPFASLSLTNKLLTKHTKLSIIIIIMIIIVPQFPFPTNTEIEPKNTKDIHQAGQEGDKSILK